MEFTMEMALAGAAFYENEAVRNPANDSARGRFFLIRHAADLLAGDRK
jgi:hypothetical protein